MHKIVSTIVCVAVLVACTAVGAYADDYVDLVRKGNEAYKAKKYKDALELYRSAEPEKPESDTLEYNVANALYGQDGYEDAITAYQKVLNSSDADLQAKAQYNLGNTYYRMQDYQKAIDAYQKTLEITPDDVDAKYNLELARKMLKEHARPQPGQNNQQQQQQPDQQEQEEEQKQQDQQGEQNKQDKTQQNQDQSQEAQQEAEQGEKKDQQKKQAADEQKMSREDAERILNALKNDEEKVQQQIKRQIQAQADGYTGKDW